MNQLVHKAFDTDSDIYPSPDAAAFTEGVPSHPNDAPLLLGHSSVLDAVYQLVSKVATSTAPVLLMGETGVGKEVVAKTIHNKSHRRASDFVAVNCATLPHDLIEAELFGVEKGAYTGAVERRKGKFERANKGTLFLDEVAELSARAQASLLRVLQEGELERVGGGSTIDVDVRIVAATNEDLLTAVHEGRFRTDLFHRLNVFQIEIPPLRKRTDDIPLLLNYFLKDYQAQYGKRNLTISNQVNQTLKQYHWPGNIRELRNAAHRAVILTEDNQNIQLTDLFPVYPTIDKNSSNENNIINPYFDFDYYAEILLSDGFDLSKFEETLINKALEKSNGNITKASDLLGVTRPALAYRIKKHAQNT